MLASIFMAGSFLRTLGRVETPGLSERNREQFHSNTLKPDPSHE